MAEIIRRHDSVALAILYVTLVQFAVGVAIVMAQPSPSPEIVVERLRYRQDTLDSRVAALEQLRLPERLALLEKSAASSEESWTEVRRIGYGLVSAVLGLIATQIVQIKGQRSRRKPEDHSGD